MKKKVLLVILVFALLGLSLMMIALYSYLSKRAWESEAINNLDAIRTAQESYFAEHGVYLECRLSPPKGGADRKPDEWVDAGGFETIGFVPHGRIRFHYAVTVSEDGKSFMATAAGSRGGKKVVYTIDSRTPTYPKPVTTEGNY